MSQAENIEKAARAAVADAMGVADRDAFTVSEFCQRHRISRTVFYQLLKHGTGPRIFKCGVKTLISREAAAEWRRAGEAAANCGSKAAAQP